MGIYTTNSAEAVSYVLQSSGSNICVVENDSQLQKVLKSWEELPDLKAVVQYDGKPNTDEENVYSVCICDRSGFNLMLMMARISITCALGLPETNCCSQPIQAIS